MQIEWPPVTFNPEDFNPQNILDSYFDVGIVISQWDVILQGALVTISLALLAEFFGSALGLILALLKISRSRLLSAPAQVYIDVFRGTPLLVQITIIYFTPASIGIRPESLFFAGLVALTLNSAAYVAEIFRAGIQSIDKGQMERGGPQGLLHPDHALHNRAAGLPARHTSPDQRVRDAHQRHLAGLRDRARGASAAQEIQSQTFNSSALIAAALIYLAICLPLIYLTNILERRLNRRVA